MTEIRTGDVVILAKVSDEEINTASKKDDDVLNQSIGTITLEPSKNSESDERAS